MIVDLRTGDLRFVLPRPPETVTLLGRARGHREAWEAAGVTTVDQSPALVVGEAADLSMALRQAPEMLAIFGRVGHRRLARAGYRSVHLLALPDPLAPRLLVPLASRRALAAALAPVGRGALLSALGRRAALALLKAGVAPTSRVLTVAARTAPQPWLLTSPSPTPCSPPPWYLWLGGGDPLQRLVLHQLDRDGSLAVKFSRVAGNSAPFAREEKTAQLTADLPAVLARHIPQVVEHGARAGLPYIIERRFPGRPMTELLGSAASRRRKLAGVEQVASWLGDLAFATRAPSSALDEERGRLVREVMPRWNGLGEPGNNISAISSVPGILAHNDLGAWNVVADDRGGFGVVDWESARHPGLPLWDLTYFLADALSVVEHGRIDDPTAAVLKIFRGESELSSVLFAHVRRAVDRLGIAPSAVGPLVTLGWLHHGLSLDQRRTKIDTLATGAGRAQRGPLGGLAPPWLADPALGWGWGAWR